MTWANKLSFILICFAIIFTTLAYGGVHQPVIAVFYITAAALLILWSIDAFKTGAVRVDNSPFQLLLVVAAAYGMIQIIPFGYFSDPAGITDVPNTISADPFSTLISSVHAVALLIVFSTCLVLLDSTARIRRLLNILTVFGFLFAFYAILQSVLSPGKIYGIYEVRYARPFGSFVNRHNFAALMEMVLSLPLALLLTGLIKRDKRLLYVTMTTIMGVSLLLSGSRGGLIALIAEIGLMVLITRRGRGRKELLIRTALAAGLFVMVIVGSIFVGGETSLSRFVETAKSQDITTSRSHIWAVTLKVIESNLPLGAGLGAFGVAYTPFDTFSGVERVEQAHNDYLQLASDLGVIGIGLAAAFLFLFFRTGLKAVKVENPFRRAVAVGAFCGCFAVVVHSLFDFVLHTTAIALVFISLISLLIAAGKSFPGEPQSRGIQKRRKHTENVVALSALH